MYVANSFLRWRTRTTPAPHPPSLHTCLPHSGNFVFDGDTQYARINNFHALPAALIGEMACTHAHLFTPIHVYILAHTHVHLAAAGSSCNHLLPAMIALGVLCVLPYCSCKICWLHNSCCCCSYYCSYIGHFIMCVRMCVCAQAAFLSHSSFACCKWLWQHRVNGIK